MGTLRPLRVSHTVQKTFPVLDIKKKEKRERIERQKKPTPEGRKVNNRKKTGRKLKESRLVKLNKIKLD